MESLREAGWDPVGFWSNPNIHPSGEYDLRRAAFEAFAGRVGLRTLFDGAERMEEWFVRSREGWEAGDRRRRCSACYRLRLERAAAVARREGYGVFTTTLLYSRHQDHEEVRRIGEDVAAASGLVFLYEDFRRGWQRGIELSKAYGLYRQRYCGCVFSEAEARRSRARSVGRG